MGKRITAPDCTADGGGSGIHSQEVETPYGECRLVHWSLSGGDVTAINIDWAWPEIRLAGHVKVANEDLLKLYFTKIIELGGVEETLAVLEAVRAKAHKAGIEEAQSKMRLALGFGT